MSTSGSFGSAQPALNPASGCAVTALLDGQLISEEAIRDHELSRARHALAYLKARLGNDAMRRLLASDLSTTADQVRDWVTRSDGRWQTATIE